MSDYDQDLERIVNELNRTVQSKPATGLTPQPAERSTPSPSPAALASLDKLLSHAAEQGASDVLLVAGTGPVLRVSGHLTELSGSPLADGLIQSMLLGLLNPSRRQELETQRSVDFSFTRENVGRFRTNIHYQRGTLAAAIRLLPSDSPTLESLHLPPLLSRLTEQKKGLVLVTGPAGSGKTTTLAAMLGIINRKQAYHVVTIEDPIEYHHTNDKAIFEQIEIGHDAPTFASALRAIVRQSPDVILVGEMRDPDTMAAALTAAETGHLVFATLHTPDTIQAIGRIVDSFPANQQNQIRQQLSLALLAIVAQQLVPAPEGNVRFPAVELLMANTAVRHLIRRGEDHMLRSQLTIGRSEGMILMEESLAGLVGQGKVDRAVAGAFTTRPDEFERFLAP